MFVCLLDRSSSMVQPVASAREKEKEKLGRRSRAQIRLNFHWQPASRSSGDDLKSDNRGKGEPAGRPIGPL